MSCVAGISPTDENPKPENNFTACHVEGASCRAEAGFTHVEGYGCIATSEYQHVQGIHNKLSTHIFVIGNGTDGNRSNAFSVDNYGKIYVNNSETGVDVLDLLNRITALEEKVAALTS